MQLNFNSAYGWEEYIKIGGVAQLSNATKRRELGKSAYVYGVSAVSFRIYTHSLYNFSPDTYTNTLHYPKSA